MERPRHTAVKTVRPSNARKFTRPAIVCCSRGAVKRLTSRWIWPAAHLGVRGPTARVPATRVARARVQPGSLRKAGALFSDPQRAGSWTVAAGRPIEVEGKVQ